ncbi:IclR family transcriptional regulator [Halorubrum sp. CSM-61]|jgi:DNA-binding IclR family transcriptional regulator|uniref:IclR family transcriptional regulator n=1 Tax=Halorubrum sp. CSM-61 TaxID=2485838 RepID=UPI000F4C179E|nr:IclR family transcriptional regulator [Halorubrum sp. CSM-61]
MTEPSIDAENGAGGDTVRTAETMFDIVRRLVDDDGASLAELASELDYAKSTVHRHLHTLEGLGYVVHRDDGYHVGLRFLEVGVTARSSYRGYDLVRRKVEEIAEVTGERAQFFVEEHGKAVYLSRAVGDQAVRTDPGIGSRIPLYAASAGKAILAELPEPELSDMFERISFDPVTKYTITDPEELRAEIEAGRERGYYFNREESLRGTHAVGVAICGPDDDVIGGLSVTGPSHRLNGERLESELPDLLLGAANELELNIAHS